MTDSGAVCICVCVCVCVCMCVVWCVFYSCSQFLFALILSHRMMPLFLSFSGLSDLNFSPYLSVFSLFIIHTLNTYVDTCRRSAIAQSRTVRWSRARETREKQHKKTPS